MSEEQLGAPEEEVDGVGDNFKGVENVQSKGDLVELEEVFAGGENELESNGRSGDASGDDLE